MSNRRIIKRVLVGCLIIGILLFGAMLKMGIDFGNAAAEAAVGIHNANEQWTKDGFDPVDTIKKHLNDSVDTISYEIISNQK